MARDLVVTVTCGSEDAERCNQAFTVAAAAVAAGSSVSLWLTGEAAWFALPSRAADFSLPLATPLPTSSPPASPPLPRRSSTDSRLSLHHPAVDPAPF